MLCRIKEVIFTLGLRLCFQGRDSAFIRQYLVVVEDQEFIHTCGKLLHVEYIATFYLPLDMMMASRL